MKSLQNDLVTSLAVLVLRLGAGGMLLVTHGWGKLMNAAARAPGFPDPIGLGPVASFWLVVFAEVLCAGFVMVGLLTRYSVVPLLGFSAVAGFVQHASDPWPKRELPFLYGVAFLAVLLAGPGRFSLDALLQRGGRRTG